ncbi:MAG: hypothetical protein O7E49_08440 [Gemmatimonadetes bacterium]|nr:hypothetical protein [Gemmatimonadota bacterium]
MRTAILPAALLCFGLATPSSAQQWTPEQQSVIAATNGCWESWGTEDWDAYLAACPIDPGVRFWWMADGTPDYGLDSWKRWADAFWPRMEVLIHFEHRPLGVQIHGDVALYQFWASWSFVDGNGQEQTMSQHRMDVYQRRDGSWTLIGGAGVPAPGT